MTNQPQLISRSTKQRLVVGSRSWASSSNRITVNGAFGSPAPDTWLEADNDRGDTSLEQLLLADALLLGRKTYEGLASARGFGWRRAGLIR